jgi:hypothetical protein
MNGTHYRTTGLALVLAPSLLLAWTWNANFELGVTGEQTHTSGLGDGFTDAAGASLYSTDEVRSGSQACVCSIDSGVTGFGMWGGIVSFPEDLYEGDELWYHIAVYWPDGFDYNSYGEGGRLKFLRVHTRSDTVGNYGYDDLYINGEGVDPPFGFIYEGEQRWFMLGTPGDSVVHDHWETYELYYKLHHLPADSGGEALVRVWKNGVLLQEITTRRTLKEPGAFANAAFVFTYWNGASPRTQSLYIDDLILTTETPANIDADGNPMIGQSSASVRPRDALHPAMVYRTGPSFGICDVLGRAVGFRQPAEMVPGVYVLPQTGTRLVVED